MTPSSIAKTISFIVKHPLNYDSPKSAVLRFVIWQVRCRLSKEIVFNWIEDAKLIVRKGMTGATGNIYCGLHEYADMSFLLHLLRPDDLFIDLGANIGSYTILASKVCQSKTIAVEADPETTVSLVKNIHINDLERLVEVQKVAVGASHGETHFSKGRDTTNQVLTASDVKLPSQIVQLRRLDDIVGDRSPTLIKMDLEGYETEALKGASKTLANPSLVAIEIETVNQEAKTILKQFGFKIRFYDPLQRKLTEETNNSSSNHLYIRDEHFISERLKTSVRRFFRSKQV